MAIKDRKAREAIVRARTNLLVSNGFFGFLSMQLKLVEVCDDEAMPTAAVDGVSLFYNPNFINQLDDRECEFLVAHEVMHCCFQHFTRRGSRDPVAWNVAGDFVINLDLQESGFKLIHNRPINGKIFKCCVDAKYKGMTTEEIYESFPKISITISGSGKPQTGNADGSESNIGGVMDAPGDVGKQETVRQNWETQVRSAVAIAKANNAGNVPGSLRHLIEQLSKPKISWRDKTRNFIDQSLAKSTSWARISRRSVSSSVLMPGLVSDRLNHLIMAVDISGSISYEMAREMVSEAAGALDEGVADQMTVIYADTDVQHVDNYVQGDIVTVGRYTGGGTAFSNTFKWITANVPEASCVIYLTDLQVYDFGEDPGCPTLWAVYATDSNYQQLADRAPFGSCLQVSNTFG